MSTQHDDTPEKLDLYKSMIGRTVRKRSNKSFKSGEKNNTVFGIVTHMPTMRSGFTFFEDDSVVECWRCKLAETYYYNVNFGADNVPTITKISQDLYTDALDCNEQSSQLYQWDKITLDGVDYKMISYDGRGFYITLDRPLEGVLSWTKKWTI